ncbi:hypothetical protein BC829DRAFT_207822 [Chytridium lagenaria]|nr:hypothetical protein BC829DRAFT_207822 [Chytridium lagenaria]
MMWSFRWQNTHLFASKTQLLLAFRQIHALLFRTANAQCMNLNEEDGDEFLRSLLCIEFLHLQAEWCQDLCTLLVR